MRTLIDILRKGNQELFHTSIISWLLDPNSEHGFGSQFIESFAKLLAEKGDSSLIDEIRQGEPIIRSEATSYKRRHDIEIRTQNSLYVMENKTKSIGGLPQFKQYEGPNVHLIALGYCDMSFSREVSENYPLVTYSDVLDILDGLITDSENDFSVLIRHYSNFLRRELQLLIWIVEDYSRGQIPTDNRILDVISSVGGYTKNDERFLNLYYLEKLREKICDNHIFERTKWNTNKNMIGGVWMANYEELPHNYIFHEDIRDLCERMGGELWFHIEMWDGVLARTPNDVAGMLQLRCSTKHSNRDFFNEFRGIAPLQEDEYYPARLLEKSGTFYVLKRSLKKNDLGYQEMVSQIQVFMERFGSFVDL